MRNKYLLLLRERLRKGDLLWFPWMGAKYLGILASAYAGRALVGPITVALTVTWRCNARCIMCDYPLRYRKDELSREEIFAFLDELKELKAAGVTLFGGEPLLRKDIFEIIAHAKRKGLMVQIPTNGILLDEEKVEKLIEAEVDVVSISLDSPEPEEFAAIRQVDGIHGKVVEGIKRLVRWKKEKESRVEIVIPATFSEVNIGRVGEMVEFAEELGVDALQVMPAQRVETLENSYGEGYRRVWLESCRELLRYKRKGGAIIDNSRAYLRYAIKELEGKEVGLKCFSPYTDLHIDPFGNVYPCAYFLGMNKPFGNVRGKSLKEFWYSKAYQKERKGLADCRKCGYLCSLELSFPFNKLWFRKKPRG